MTVKYAPDFYTNPPKTAIPGARLDYREISLLTTDMVTTNIFALGILPAGHKLLDFTLETADLDGASSATIDVGLLNHYYNGPEASVADPGWDAGTTPAIVTADKFIAASTVARAGGFKKPDATFALGLVIGVDPINDRIIAFQFAAAPGTAVAGKVAFVAAIDEV